MLGGSSWVFRVSWLWELFLTLPFHRCVNRGSERSGDLYKVILRELSAFSPPQSWEGPGPRVALMSLLVQRAG